MKKQSQHHKRLIELSDYYQSLAENEEILSKQQDLWFIVHDLGHVIDSLEAYLEQDYGDS